jgi:DNA-binding NtrC family response regulator
MKSSDKAGSTILLVDDEAGYRALFGSVLKEHGFQVVIAASGSEALELAGRGPIDLAVLDLVMPGMDGREVFQRLRRQFPEMPIVFLTAYGSIPSAVEAIREGADEYLTKPLDHIDDLPRTVSRVLGRKSTGSSTPDVSSPAKEPEPFLTADPVMMGILAQAERIARSDVTVLISGESGTGKEQLAKFLQQKSSRQSRPMVVVNCAAIPENLLESELFGHEKGAFTGAVAARIGRFEEAHRSTIFLDEIGEMPLSLQPKLLRVLQDKEIRRVGGTQTFQLDFRLIAATNRNLREEIQHGRFREDLFYRLSVVSLHIPPLRDRPRDIALLSASLVREFSRRAGRGNLELAPETKRALQTQPWRGNVRELANCLEATVLLSEGDLIHPEDLRGLEGTASPIIPAENGNLRDEAEKRVIREALTRAAGNRKEAARLLSMTPRNLFYKLKKFGISK